MPKLDWFPFPALHSNGSANPSQLNREQSWSCEVGRWQQPSTWPQIIKQIPIGAIGAR